VVLSSGDNTYAGARRVAMKSAEEEKRILSDDARLV
jgi:hypothetical protein